MNSGEIENPTLIYIVSSKGITSSTLKLFEDINELRMQVIQSASKSLKKNKISFTDESLENFLSFLKNQDYSIIKNIDIDVIAFDYYNSELGSTRFYKKEPFRFRVNITKNDFSDETFINQIKNIYNHSNKLNQIISDAKDNFYSCLCLKETDKYLYGNNDEFDLAKEEVYQNVNMLFYNEDKATDTYVKCLDKSTQTIINTSLLGVNGLNLVNNSDKKGFCHYLVNESKLKWEQKDE